MAERARAAGRRGDRQTRPAGAAVGREAVGIEALGVVPQALVAMDHPGGDVDGRAPRHAHAADLVIFQHRPGREARCGRVETHRFLDDAAGIGQGCQIGMARGPADQHAVEFLAGAGPLRPGAAHSRYQIQHMATAVVSWPAMKMVTNWSRISVRARPAPVSSSRAAINRPRRSIGPASPRCSRSSISAWIAASSSAKIRAMRRARLCMRRSRSPGTRSPNPKPSASKPSVGRPGGHRGAHAIAAFLENIVREMILSASCSIAWWISITLPSGAWIPLFDQRHRRRRHGRGIGLQALRRSKAGAMMRR